MVTIGSRKKPHVQNGLRSPYRRHETMMGKGEDYLIKLGTKDGIVLSGARKNQEKMA